MTSDQEINVAIAELCGWQHCHQWKFSGGRFRKGSLIGTSPDLEQLTYVPNYANDLNAMHSAEAAIVDWRRYSDVLMQVIEDSIPELAVRFLGDRVGLRYYSTHATARQRAEAFLRVKGKWKE